MHDSEWRVKVLKEVQQIPDAKLAQLYEMIHGFRLSSETNNHNAAAIMQFAGCWNDMSDEAYGEFSDEIAIRRQQAFSQRQNRETSID
ncbi:MULTISPECIES: hypothetical protein [unclassified Nostoc]|uniref:hypothetical protein n=1 Tax=unclassified Nostoc TaxID=2593658 RepID=UPI000DED232D|nr:MULTISPECIES: hypothetical protein [unclassified Nostoc]MBD2523806.1 hypothetical protein [Nostoc sp. FACHB-133]QHG16206.1 hypothetical protein GJB62_09615 [Nostoc sp. ATCC 53789]RCJ20816.1 hypothetical protein A6V25_05550 [Nostoc sp. ATCC 53789]